ncbi:flagellar hook-length control protein FliK [Bacillus sp. FJAT-27445]|uniref:flagellar hook-length control protein FliK n=1 Tax=Bacillus sp. FJAT-27445 TaxID=1679166 RepID=UPI0007440968|nr:flagellar hook-length control protein FliK [Bacillus sp. FJAT-27445]
MIQPTAFGNVNKAASIKGKETETDGTQPSSFDSLLQMVSAMAEGDAKTHTETGNPFNLMNQVLLQNPLINSSGLENASPEETGASDKGGAGVQLLGLQQGEAITPQNGKQWDLSILNQSIEANGKSPLIAELRGMIDEKINNVPEDLQKTGGPVINSGGQEADPANILKPTIQVHLNKETTSFLAVNPVQTENPLVNGLKIPVEKVSAGIENEAAILPEEAGPTADIEADITTSEGKPAHSLQPPINRDAPPILRASHFEQDIKQIIQSAYQGQEVPEGLDGMKTAINVQRLANGVEAIIKLSPENLGNIEVKLNIQEGQIKAEFLAGTAQGKELLETHINALRSALELQGLQVGKIDISQQAGNNFMGAFSQKGDAHPRQGQHDSRKRSEEKVPAEEKYQDYGLDTGTYSQINTTA